MVAQRKKKAREAQGARSRRPYIAGVILVGVILGYGAYVRFGVQSDELGHLFELLEEHGFTPNVGLSDLYLPGNVLQTAERGPDGEERWLAAPLPFLWAEDCFPELEPRAAPFPLPETVRQAGASLTLGGQAVSRLVPQLDLEDAAVAHTRLELEAPRILTFTRPELSRAFAPACVDALRDAVADGDELAWHEVVIQAVVVDGLRYEIHWRADTAAETRLDLGSRAAKALDTRAELAATADEDAHTVLEVATTVVLGYRTRPLEPAFEETPGTSQEMPGTSQEMPGTFKSATHAPLEGRLALRLLDGRAVGFDRPFETGEHFRFEVTASRDAWLFIHHQRPGGELELLWPTDPGEQQHRLRAGEARLVPGPEEAFRFVDETGAERFYVALDATSDATAPGERRHEVENFLVRSLAGDGRNAPRGVEVARPGAEPYLSFADGDESGVAAVELQLRHQR